MEEKVLALLLIMIVVIAVVNKFSSSHFLKLILHTVLYLFEIILVTYIMNRLFIRFDLFELPTTYLEALRNYMFYFSIYQLILLVTFKLFDSTKIDSLNAIKKHIDQSQIFAEFDKPIPEKHLQKILKLSNSKEMMVNQKHRKYAQKIFDYSQEYNDGNVSKEDYRCALKLEALEIDLAVKELGYNWVNCVLLRMVK